LSTGALVNNGDLILSSNTIDGPVTNNTGANITAIGNVTFNDLVDGPGGFFGPGTITFNGGMSPGASPAEVTFEGDAVFGLANTLFIEVGGTTSGSQFDQINSLGTISLGGTLDVDLISGFMPGLGDSFEILTAAGGISGTFDTELLPTLTGNLVLDVVYGANSVSLVAVLPGDYNFDGSVDAADYVVWRKSDGTQEGYDAWQANFGQIAAGGGAGDGAFADSSSVPEPASMALMLLASLVLALPHRRRINSEKFSRPA
jgi:hypothetical protein